MRHLITFTLLILFPLIINAQVDAEREKIPGKVNVRNDGDPGKINVFNLSSGQYTFTDEYGRFDISVKEGDELVFSGLLYEQFSVIVTESVMENEKLDITLNEGATQLDEVVVKPGLSGDVEVDVSRLGTDKTDYLDIDVEEVLYGFNYKPEPDQYSTAENSAINKQYLEHGINFANIFKALFIKRNEAQDEEKENLDVEIRKVHNDEFFKKYLDIKEENINDFVYFLEENGLDEEKIKTMNDLELVEFLMNESEDYKE